MRLSFTFWGYAVSLEFQLIGAPEIVLTGLRIVCHLKERSVVDIAQCSPYFLLIFRTRNRELHINLIFVSSMA